MTTIQEFTDYIKTNRKRLNLADLCRYIGFDRGDMNKALNGIQNNKGTVIKIPDRCLPYLKEYFTKLGVLQPG